MSFGWTLLGTIGQLMLAYFLFMVVIFSAGGVANDAQLSNFHLRILTLSIYLLPALCLVSAGIVLYLHGHAGSAASYWWYAMPLAAAALYLAYAIALNHNG